MFLTQVIFDLLRESTEEEIIRFFGWSVSFLLAAFVVLGFPKRTRRFARQFAPGILTSVGILGTFAGITSGLLTFNEADINASVPRLLEGLKVAFGTSILGLVAALFYRLFFLGIEAFQSDDEGGEEVDPLEELEKIRKSLSREDGDKESVFSELVKVREAIEKSGSKEVLHALRAMDESIKNSGQESVAALKEVSRALRRDDEDSVLGQIKFLKSAVEDLRRETKDNLEKQISETKSGFEAQIGAFKEFAKEMAENNAKTLLEGLERLIGSFQDAITKHIGKNFEHLSNAVTQLVEWQENYKQQMLEMKAAMETATQGIEKSRDSLQEISAAVSEIPTSTERVTELIRLLGGQVAHLETQLKVFEATAKTAQQSFPDIKAKLEGLSEGLAATAREQTEAFRQIIESQQESAERLRGGFAALDASVRETTGVMKAEVQEASRALSGTAAAFEASVQATSGAMQKSVEQTTDQMQRSVHGVATEMGQAAEAAAKSMRESVGEATGLMQTSIEGIAGEVEKAVGGAVDGMHQSIEGNLEEMRKSVESTMKEVRARMAENLIQWDTQMKDQMRDAMGKMANELGAIAEEVAKIINEWRRRTDGRMS